MEKNGWRERIDRAKSLAEQYPFSREVLTFYVQVARFQAGLRERMEKLSSGEASTVASVSGPPELSELIASFVPFLSLVEKTGPKNLAAAASELKSAAPPEQHTELLNNFWDAT